MATKPNFWVIGYSADPTRQRQRLAQPHDVRLQFQSDIRLNHPLALAHGMSVDGPARGLQELDISEVLFDLAATILEVRFLGLYPLDWD